MLFDCLGHEPQELDLSRGLWTHGRISERDTESGDLFYVTSWLPAFVVKGRSKLDRFPGSPCITFYSGLHPSARSWRKILSLYSVLKIGTQLKDSLGPPLTTSSMCPTPTQPFQDTSSSAYSSSILFGKWSQHMPEWVPHNTHPMRFSSMASSMVK